MNKPVSEVRRLREQLAQKTRELTELSVLVAKHVEATAGAHERELARERAAYERGRDVTQREYDDGFNLGHDVALGAFEEARPFVAGVREGFTSGCEHWQEIAEDAFSALRQRPDRLAPDLDLEIGA
jgi:hypothetical protein